MKSLMKSAQIIGQVFGLVFGDNFTTPATHTIEQYPYLRFYA